jgi:hypothetical protein
MSTILFILVLVLAVVALMAVLLIHDRRAAALARRLEKARHDEIRVHLLVEDYLRSSLRSVTQNSGYPEGSINQIMLLESCRRLEKEFGQGLLKKRRDQESQTKENRTEESAPS